MRACEQGRKCNAHGEVSMHDTQSNTHGDTSACATHSNATCEGEASAPTHLHATASHSRGPVVNRPQPGSELWPTG